MKVKVDLDLCQGHSVCLEECPEVFAVEEQEDGYAKVVLLNDSPELSLTKKVASAIQYCPSNAISAVEYSDT